MEESQSGQATGAALTPWEPQRYLRRVSAQQVKFSRGFMRCRPERWFPGFAAQWLPLAHSLGIELRIVEVQPFMGAPRGLERGYVGTVDGEQLAMLVDGASARVLVDAFVPGAQERSGDVMLEYLARRLLSSLTLSWSGPQPSQVNFRALDDAMAVTGLAAVKLALLVNGSTATIWVLLGEKIVERFDTLWRGQLRSSLKSSDREGGGDESVALEIAQLAVTPTLLVDYMRAGTVVDLEQPVSDIVTLRMAGKAWMPARVCVVDGMLGFEVVTGSVQQPVIAEGTTRLTIEFAREVLPANLLPELSQVGAMFSTNVAVSNVVRMVINNEKVGEATLCTYEGRFAVSVR